MNIQADGGPCRCWSLALCAIFAWSWGGADGAAAVRHQALVTRGVAARDGVVVMVLVGCAVAGTLTVGAFALLAFRGRQHRSPLTSF
jgi:hypothetical protein